MKQSRLNSYFNISNLLKGSTLRDFDRYKKKLHVEHIEYNEDDKISELFKFYNFSSEINSNTIFEKLDLFRKLLLTFMLFLGVMLTYIYFDKEINLKVYLMFSFALPFLYMLWSGYNILRYKFPSKSEKSYINTFLSRYEEYDDRHNHIVKTYSIRILLESGLSYSVGVFVATVFVFWAFSITFYTETTYAGSIDFNTSKEFWSLALTSLIFFLIFLKTILWFLATKKLTKSIESALNEQGEKFFTFMRVNHSIEANKRDKQNSNNTLHVESNSYNDIDYNEDSEYCILYYNMELSYKPRVDFDFSRDVDLNSKSSLDFSFALFDREEEDKIVLKKLKNLVMIFTLPQALPDNTFKDDIELILNNSDVKVIWVAPLVKKENSQNYTLAKIGDEKYDEWQKQININIANQKVRLYYDK